MALYPGLHTLTLVTKTFRIPTNDVTGRQCCLSCSVSNGHFQSNAKNSPRTTSKRKLIVKICQNEAWSQKTNVFYPYSQIPEVCPCFLRTLLFFCLNLLVYFLSVQLYNCLLPQVHRHNLGDHKVLHWNSDNDQECPELWASSIPLQPPSTMCTLEFSIIHNCQLNNQVTHYSLNCAGEQREIETAIRLTTAMLLLIYLTPHVWLNYSINSFSHVQSGYKNSIYLWVLFWPDCLKQWLEYSKYYLLLLFSLLFDY